MRRPISGTLSFSDPDYSDTHTASVTNVSAGLGEVAPPSLTETDLFGLLQLTEPLVDTTDGAGGSITYTFNGVEDQFDYLAVGESVTLTYTITLEDNNGGSDTQDVAVTITGVNDAPDVVNDSFHVSEDAASVIKAKTSVSTGSVLDNDTRPGPDGHSLRVGGGGGRGGRPRHAGGNRCGREHGRRRVGTLTLNADGTYSYSFLNTDAVITGETIHDVFHYQIFDGHGGYYDATLTINIAGTDLDLTITPAPADPHDSDPFVAQRGHDIVQGVADGETFKGGTATTSSTAMAATTLSSRASCIVTDAPHDGFDIYDGGADTDTVDYSSTTLGVTVDLTAKDRSSEAVLGTNAVGSDPTTVGELLLLGAVAGGYAATRDGTCRRRGDRHRRAPQHRERHWRLGRRHDHRRRQRQRPARRRRYRHDTWRRRQRLRLRGRRQRRSRRRRRQRLRERRHRQRHDPRRAGYDVLDGGDETDTVDYSATTLGVTVALTALNRDAEAVTPPDGAGGNPDTIGEMLLAAGVAVAVPTGLSVGRADGSEIGTDALINIENATGGSGDDTILGNEITNVLKGGGGIDHIWGEGGSDEIHGGDGNDVLVGDFGTGGAGYGDDTLYGDAGDDQLYGEDGNDILWGGTGSDQYAGGTGNDTLYFEGDGESDTAWGGE